MKKNIVILIVIGVLAAAGAAFYGGVTYGRSKGACIAGNRAGGANFSPEERQARFQQFGGGMMNGGQRGSFREDVGFVAGEVIAKDAQSITVKLRDGGSKIVLYSDTVAVDMSVKGTAADIEVGKTVSITGKANQDGSISAQSIQVRPAPVAPAPTAVPSAQ
jgi:hypothetical protein